MMHIWCFTIAVQGMYDLFVDVKYGGYHYFSEEIEWRGLPARLFLTAPANIIFLNLFPFEKNLFVKIAYIFLWEVIIVCYEWVTLLPEPWGFFRYEWWKISYSVILDPFLMLIIFGFYYVIRKVEKKSCEKIEE